MGTIQSCCVIANQYCYCSIGVAKPQFPATESKKQTSPRAKEVFALHKSWTSIYIIFQKQSFYIPIELQARRNRPCDSKRPSTLWPAYWHVMIILFTQSDFVFQSTPRPIFPCKGLKPLGDKASSVTPDIYDSHNFTTVTSLHEIETPIEDAEVQTSPSTLKYTIFMLYYKVLESVLRTPDDKM